ncbi:MAG: cell division inhibitor [Flavobacteriales bacterium]|nr:MAG: cell division inhibitor [Flavobacteriales bacterium]|tara:strand:+ start:186 stop:647 length:462 start_codon:yes stop_codon:yes gene_type:complete
MKIYRFVRTQKIPINIKEAWNFLSDPNNLKTITPSYMGFHIIKNENTEMYSGQIIKYTVSPILGIKINWVTEITHVKNLEYFVDEQRFGPYSFWHHKHFIKEIKGGVEMVDILDYALPFGILGRIFHPVIVKPKLNEIFNYRREKLIKIFGNF